MKKDRFWPFYQFSVFSGVGGFVKRKKKTVFGHFIGFRHFWSFFGHFFVENRVLDSK